MQMIQDMRVNLSGAIYTKEDLERYAQQLSQKHWGVPFTGTIEVTNRYWRSMNACFCFNRQDPSVQIIRFSSKKNAERSAEEVLGTLLHELVHWRLHTQGIPAHDTAPEFVAECIRVGASFSESKNAQEAARKYGDRR